MGNRGGDARAEAGARRRWCRRETRRIGARGSIETIDAIERLRVEAKEVGDEVVGLLGNHELMTLQGDYRFVAREELLALGDPSADRAGVGEAEKGLGLGARAYLQAGTLEWGKMFARGSERGEVVREKPWAVVRGRGRCATAFAHAGLLPEHLLGEDGVDALNAEGKRLLAVERVGRDHELLVGDGPVWTRDFHRRRARGVRRRRSGDAPSRRSSPRRRAHCHQKRAHRNTVRWIDSHDRRRDVSIIRRITQRVDVRREPRSRRDFFVGRARRVGMRLARV